MPIQWFPGHMTSARKKAAEAMAQIDVVVEVVDARCPEASSNPMIRELRLARQRPCLRLLNKADLADPQVTKAWLQFYNKQPGVKAVAISCKKAGDAAKVPSLCQSLAPHRNDGTKPLRIMIMGIPNVGKSTLLNALAKKRIAAVGDEPAVTKQQQRIDLGPRLTLIDTPGLMWPKIEHDGDGYMLAASHAIGVNAVIEEEVAVFLADLLVSRYPDRIAARYGLPVAELDGVGVIEGVARKRGCLVPGRSGEYNLEKASIVFLGDYRSGALGRISLESPASRVAMLTQSEVALASETPVSNRVG